MSECQKMTSYLDRRLAPTEQARFLAHVQNCPDCSRALSSWNNFQDSLNVWTQSTEQPAPTTGEAYRLVGRVTEKHEHPRRALKLAFGTLAASAALALALFAFWQPKPDVLNLEPAAPVQIAANEAHSFVIDSTNAPRQLKTVGNDVLGLGPDSIVRVHDMGDNNVELSLLKGTVATKVAKRKNGQNFRIKAREYTIEVMGTRFMTTLSDEQGLTVVVLEGTVRVVEHSGRSWLLHTGKSLEVAPELEAKTKTAANDEIDLLNVLLSEPSGEVKSEEPDKKVTRRQRKHLQDKTKAAETGLQADYDGWRGLILQGKLQDAARGIGGYLKNNDSDAKAWSLLADCRRKMNDWSAAVHSYKKVITTGTPSKANRARYMAASILQKELGNHKEAISLLETYLAATHKKSDLSEMAKVQLARSLIATGKFQAAKKLLEGVISTQESDSILSKNAVHLLESLR